MKLLPGRASKTRDHKKLLKRACERFDLVYFGAVSQHGDEHHLVRGFTLSPSHIDQHYCVGTVSGHDVILLQRTDMLAVPGAKPRQFSWIILQVDLSFAPPVHLIATSYAYDVAVYHKMIPDRSFGQYDQHTLTSYSERFTTLFKLFAELHKLSEVHELLTPQRADVLAHHFSGFDYEIVHDRLMVYLASPLPRDADIERMFQAGIWLAEEIDRSRS